MHHCVAETTQEMRIHFDSQFSLARRGPRTRCVVVSLCFGTRSRAVHAAGKNVSIAGAGNRASAEKTTDPRIGMREYSLKNRCSRDYGRVPSGRSYDLDTNRSTVRESAARQNEGRTLRC